MLQIEFVTTYDFSRGVCPNALKSQMSTKSILSTLPNFCAFAPLRENFPPKIKKPNPASFSLPSQIKATPANSKIPEEKKESI
jgi:hypothetical protein